MKKFVAPILVAALLVPGAPALAQKRSDQGEARKEMRAGNVLSLRQIEGRVVPGMQGKGQQYLGPAYDSTAMAYRLKFIRGPQVVYIDVDARTGAIIGKSGF